MSTTNKNLSLIRKFKQENQIDSDFETLADAYYIPLAESLVAHHYGAKLPFFVGINGSQGSGKSTLAKFLSEYLSQVHQLKVVVLSLDDFYLNRSERLSLSIKIHPLFKTRGVPGTHNMDLAESVLTKLAKNEQDIVLPRFNKATDNQSPISEWQKIDGPVDIVLFEGWCWGLKAQPQTALHKAVNSMEELADELGVWRSYSNSQLKAQYQPLYKRMNYWVMLKAPAFNDVYAWRLEQEHKLRTANADNEAAGIMSDEQIKVFIQHYQRLTEHALDTMPASCDTVYELDSARNIVKVIETADE